MYPSLENSYITINYTTFFHQRRSHLLFQLEQLLVWTFFDSPILRYFNFLKLCPIFVVSALCTLWTINDAPWKDPQGSFHLLWKHPLKAVEIEILGVFPGELPSQKLERPPGFFPRGVFPGTSLTVHTVYSQNEIISLEYVQLD